MGNISKKFYLGTSLLNADIANSSIKALEKAGFQCSFNWTGIVEDFEELPALEIEAIRAADFCVFLLPGRRGTHIEIGAAIALNKPTHLLKLESLYEEPDIPFYRLLGKSTSLKEIINLES